MLVLLPRAGRMETGCSQQLLLQNQDMAQKWQFRKREWLKSLLLMCSLCKTTESNCCQFRNISNNLQTHPCILFHSFMFLSCVDNVEKKPTPTKPKASNSTLTIYLHRVEVEDSLQGQDFPKESELWKSWPAVAGTA